MFSLSTLVGVVGLLLGAGSYLFKTHRSLCLVAGGSALSWGMHFAMLNAWTAAALMGVAAARILSSIWVVQQAKRTRLFLTAVGMLAGVALTGLTWQGMVSVPVLLASLVFTYAGFNLGYPQMRPALFVGELLLLVNGLLTGSEVAVIACLLGLAMNVTGALRDKRTQKRASYTSCLVTLPKGKSS